MADFDYIPINTTAEKIEKISNMDVLTGKVETENDNTIVSATALLKTLVGNVDLINYYTKTEIDSMLGDLDAALDAILAIQEDLIDGDYTINLNAEEITLVDKSTELNYKMYVDNAKVKLEEV